MSRLGRIVVVRNTSVVGNMLVGDSTLDSSTEVADRLMVLDIPVIRLGVLDSSFDILLHFCIQ